MLCDRVLRNVYDAGPSEASVPIDPVEVAWHELDRRALRKTTRAGRLLRILLPPGGVLRHGDVLAEDERGRVVVVVDVPETEVLVARPRTFEETGVLALELGNLHVPTQVTPAGELLFVPDGPVEALLSRLGVPHDRQVRRFEPRYVEAAPVVALSAGFAVVAPGA